MTDLAATTSTPSHNSTVTTSRRPGVLAVHSVDQVVFTVPDIAPAIAFYTAFGMNVKHHDQQVDLYTHGHPHCAPVGHAARHLADQPRWRGDAAGGGAQSVAQRQNAAASTARILCPNQRAARRLRLHAPALPKCGRGGCHMFCCSARMWRA